MRQSEQANHLANRAIRLVMADVDGTLVTPEKDLTERARLAVFQLRNAGLEFTIISSRPPYGLRSLARDLQLDLPLIAFNGGMLTTPDGQPVRAHYLAQTLIPDILDCLTAHGLSPRLYTPDRWLIESPNQPHAAHEACTIETEPTLVNDFKPYLASILKITGVSDDHAAVAQCQQAMQAMLAGRASALCSQPYYLDITHKLANKGHAVTMVAEAREISTDNIAVIGDMPSDVPMFQHAGLSIAMGNASDEVKHQADYVTDSNAADGFAKAMEAYILSCVSEPGAASASAR